MPTEVRTTEYFVHHLRLGGSAAPKESSLNGRSTVKAERRLYNDWPFEKLDPPSEWSLPG